MYLQHFAIFLNSQGYSGYIVPPQKYHFSQHTAYVFTKAEIKKLFISLDQMEYTPNSPYRHLVSAFIPDALWMRFPHIGAS